MLWKRVHVRRQTSHWSARAATARRCCYGGCRRKLIAAIIVSSAQFLALIDSIRIMIWSMRLRIRVYSRLSSEKGFRRPLSYSVQKLIFRAKVPQKIAWARIEEEMFRKRLGNID